jgi:hypothetical protein
MENLINFNALGHVNVKITTKKKNGAYDVFGEYYEQWL